MSERALRWLESNGGMPPRGVLMVGLRGVGKTVLLGRMLEDAEESGALTLRIEAPEDRSLPEMLAPQIRQVLLAASKMEQARELGKRGLRVLAGFASALKIKFADFDVAFDFQAEQGLADSGDLEHDLPNLLETVAAAAAAAGKGLVLFIDELQYVAVAELSALIAALHRTGSTALAGHSHRCRPAAASRPSGGGEVLRGAHVRVP